MSDCDHIVGYESGDLFDVELAAVSEFFTDVYQLKHIRLFKFCPECGVAIDVQPIREYEAKLQTERDAEYAREAELQKPIVWPI